MEKQTLNFWPDWQITDLIGSGSFGKVYKAERTEYGTTHYSAIKMISVPKNDTEVAQIISSGVDANSISDYYDGVIKDLLNEINLMISLKGTENIVSIEDYKIIKNPNGIGGVIFIRMELLEPFDKYIEDKDISEDEIVTLGINICSALEHCQTLNIIHRDIKPENIFVTKFGTFKLGDFGIARKLDKLSDGLSHKGTFNYVAPEVFNGKAYDSTVDTYSLSIVMYKLLNHNRLPFLPSFPQNVSYKDTEAALAIRMGGLQNMPLPQNCSAKLGKIILTACAFHSENRYSTPAEMKSALLEYQTNKTVSSAAYGDNFTNPNATVNISSTSVPIAKPVYTQQQYKQDQQKKEAAKNKKFTIFMVITIVVLVAVATAFAVMLFGGGKGSNASSSNITSSQQPSSSKSSSSATEAQSQIHTKPPVDSSSEAPTKAPTEAPTVAPTEPATEPPTMAPTEPITEPVTDAPTESVPINTTFLE